MCCPTRFTPLVVSDTRERGATVLARVRSFLPQMDVANKQLEDAMRERPREEVERVGSVSEKRPKPRKQFHK